MATQKLSFGERVVLFLGALSVGVLVWLPVGLDEYEARYVLVELAVTPAAATLTVDGRTEDAHRASEAVRLSRGKHSFLLAAAGYVPWLMERDLPGGWTRMPIGLFPREVPLIINTTPADLDLRVTLDGREVNPKEELWVLPNKEHTIVARAAGYRSQTCTRMVSVGHPCEVSFPAFVRIGLGKLRDTYASDMGGAVRFSAPLSAPDLDCVWTLGDGSEVKGTGPFDHVYQAQGVFPVRLTATTDGGDTTVRECHCYVSTSLRVSDPRGDVSESWVDLEGADLAFRPTYQSESFTCYEARLRLRLQGRPSDSPRANLVRYSLELLSDHAGTTLKDTIDLIWRREEGVWRREWRTLSDGQWTLESSEVTKLAPPGGNTMEVVLLAPRSFDPATIVSWHAYAVAADPQLGGGVVDETSEVEWLVNH